MKKDFATEAQSTQRVASVFCALCDSVAYSLYWSFGFGHRFGFLVSGLVISSLGSRFACFLDLSKGDFMPRGSKAKYSDKQKREAEHIEEGYEHRGVPAKEAKRRAWATVNKIHGGGEKSGSGRGRPENHEPNRKGGTRGGRASASRPAAARSASARKAARTRARRGS